MPATRAPDLPIKPDDLNAPYFTVPEAAYVLRLSVKTLRRRIAAGLIGVSRDHGRIIVSRRDMDLYYEATRVHAEPIRRGGGRPRRRPATSQVQAAA
ncbi:helix-turn-helix domain-containing protein [Streptomyces sp. NPDC058322]|uniref:helix-turn-helix domain-containing protein n=1 Tax=Streptomyces sp. NPDC058322 TaxID=3346446 RepID=UPI0036EE6744